MPGVETSAYRPVPFKPVDFAGAYAGVKTPAYRPVPSNPADFAGAYAWG